MSPIMVDPRSVRRPAGERASRPPENPFQINAVNLSCKGSGRGRHGCFKTLSSRTPKRLEKEDLADRREEEEEEEEEEKDRSFVRECQSEPSPNKYRTVRTRKEKKGRERVASRSVGRSTDPSKQPRSAAQRRWEKSTWGRNLERRKKGTEPHRIELAPSFRLFVQVCPPLRRVIVAGVSSRGHRSLSTDCPIRFETFSTS